MNPYEYLLSAQPIYWLFYRKKKNPSIFFDLEV